MLFLEQSCGLPMWSLGATWWPHVTPDPILVVKLLLNLPSNIHQHPPSSCIAWKKISRSKKKKNPEQTVNILTMLICLATALNATPCFSFCKGELSTVTSCVVFAPSFVHSLSSKATEDTYRRRFSLFLDMKPQWKQLRTWTQKGNRFKTSLPLFPPQPLKKPR